ncbi:hypothetical protein SAMN06297229_2382 [Pseudidiomarina planktonica]|uniref:Uncharacterized protein n=1 Tax=Pseudidiomarina planktonica TaxID=1323738 RepID=A0A1Y6G409_9GAMM|nr:hypothetical protein [Pseudidiomarina planktonica]RUO62876.1 hypothetical protein CWI77_11835 [Pseudidiomarina planktonica]SMQ80762.1 hypothetical protein SAMN06297229_2382 [Pseudidiomarina planktonica]
MPKLNRWQPLGLVALVGLVFLFGWLPSGMLDDSQRQQKPQLYLSVTGTENNASLTTLAEDISSRLAARHELVLVPQASPSSWRLFLSINQQQRIVIQAELTAPIQTRDDQPRVARFVVDGAENAAPNLSAQVVDMTLSEITSVNE